MTIEKPENSPLFSSNNEGGHEICVLIEGGKWQENLREVHQIIPHVAHTVLRKQYEGKHCVELTIQLSDDLRIQQLNNQFRGQDKPTNVLSFPYDGQGDAPFFLKDTPLPLGDIVLAWETIYHESIQQNKPFKNHFIHLLVHGILHLLGFDHIYEKDAIEMETCEIDLLKDLNIPNPYHVIE